MSYVQNMAVMALIEGLPTPQDLLAKQIRDLIIATNPLIQEHIKWKAPSFFITDDFATFELRKMPQVNIVFHIGAKVRKTAIHKQDFAYTGLKLKWPALDRCIVTFDTVADFEDTKHDLRRFTQQWISALNLS